MVFSSPIFLFLFLPLVVLFYHVFRSRAWKNGVLLFSSLIFYTWGEQEFIFLMLFSIVVNYLFGLWIEKERGLLSVLFGLIVNLGLLAYFKYFTFLTESISDLIANDFSFNTVHLPIGISFYTFQSISYLLDVYRGKNKAQRNIFDLGLYISLFPQLIAGPIIRYHDVAHQIRRRKESSLGLFYGLQRFLLGLAQKVILANPLGKVAEDIFNLPEDDMGTSLAWLGAICYSFQIFFDFSGYSAMAIGIGRMFGFKFLENFNYPYISRSIQEFWRRWHISLSNWFRDYLYIPLGGSRGASFRTYVNLWIVFVLCGLWHGASWNFFWWGIYHGFFLIIERMIPIRLTNPFLKFGSHIYTILVIIFGWVLFNTNNLSEALNYSSNMIQFKSSGLLIYKYWNAEVITLLILAVFFSMPILLHVKSRLRFENRFPVLTTSFQSVGMLLLAIITMAYVATDTYNPFLYFRF